MSPATLPIVTVESVRQPATTEPSLPRKLLDPESREWLESLRATGTVRDEAVSRLHALLLRAARFEAGRRRPTLPHLRGNELEDIALEAADDALMSVLGRLHDRHRGRVDGNLRRLDCDLRRFLRGNIHDGRRHRADRLDEPGEVDRRRRPGLGLAERVDERPDRVDERPEIGSYRRRSAAGGRRAVPAAVRAACARLCRLLTKTRHPSGVFRLKYKYWCRRSAATQGCNSSASVQTVCTGVGVVR